MSTIWYLERRREEGPFPSYVEPVGYDEAICSVVVAPNELRARRIASEQAGDEGPAMWTDSARSTCAPIGYAVGNLHERLVVREFNNG